VPVGQITHEGLGYQKVAVVVGVQSPCQKNGFVEAVCNSPGEVRLPRDDRMLGQGVATRSVGTGLLGTICGERIPMRGCWGASSDGMWTANGY